MPRRAARYGLKAASRLALLLVSYNAASLDLPKPGFVGARANSRTVLAQRSPQDSRRRA